MLIGEQILMIENHIPDTFFTLLDAHFHGKARNKHQWH
jgi:hypothetical protein